MSPRQALRAAPAAQSISAWLPSAVLTPLTEINQQCIDLLCDLAASDDSPLPLVRELAPLWRNLGAESRRLLAACPFLLVDAGFSDEQRWSRLRAPGQFEASRTGPGTLLPLPTGFARRVLVYGWHLARAYPSTARVALGMTPGCLAQVSALGLQEIDQLCDVQPTWVRPRWESRPDVWRPLLHAVARPSEEALQRVVLRGIQLLAGAALVPPVPAR